MLKSALPAALLLFACCSSSGFFGAPNAAQRAEVRDLVRQLGLPDIETRETATDRLRDIGEAAVPQLRRALDHKDPEVRARVRQLLAELDFPEQPGPGDWFVLSLRRDRLVNLAGRTVWRPHTSSEGLARYLKAYRDSVRAESRAADGYIVHIRVQHDVQREILEEVLGIISGHNGIPSVTMVRPRGDAAVFAK